MISARESAAERSIDAATRSPEPLIHSPLYDAGDTRCGAFGCGRATVGIWGIGMRCVGSRTRARGHFHSFASLSAATLAVLAFAVSASAQNNGPSADLLALTRDHKQWVMAPH